MYFLDNVVCFRVLHDIVVCTIQELLCLLLFLVNVLWILNGSSVQCSMALFEISILLSFVMQLMWLVPATQSFNSLVNRETKPKLFDFVFHDDMWHITTLPVNHSNKIMWNMRIRLS